MRPLSTSALYLSHLFPLFRVGLKLVVERVLSSFMQQ